MGKIDHTINLPTNPSLSYTLSPLKSFVTLTPAEKDSWQPLAHPDCKPLTLSEKAQQRFLAHLDFLRNHFNVEGHFTVSSANNFPANCGLASSAASFAALTLAALDAIGQTEIPLTERATLARHGSGSACRSLMAPWVVWEHDKVYAIDLPYIDLIHHVVIIESEPKTISSSEAHRLVMSSPHFRGRVDRAIERKDQLILALCSHDWEAAYELVWQECEDMHELFHTAETPFHYMTDASQAVIEYTQDFWQKNGDGPLITMDAGPNVHLLFRADQTELANTFMTPLKEKHHVL